MVESSIRGEAITFELPDLLEHWPWPRLVHPSLGTIDVESTEWLSDYHFFKKKAQESFDRCLIGRHLRLEHG